MRILLYTFHSRYSTYNIMFSTNNESNLYTWIDIYYVGEGLKMNNSD